MSKHRQNIFQEELDKMTEADLLSLETANELKTIHRQYYAMDEQKEKEAKQAAIALSTPPVVPSPPVKEEKPKIIRSPQEIRDRNITWTLILGVLLFLIGGLVFATNNWTSMNPFMKTGLIALVALVLYGMSFVANRIFHIAKTSFAFLTLSSLFVPLILISAGYFELFGFAFSLQSDQKFLFATVSGMVTLPLYISIGRSYQSRMFVWISLVNLSLVSGFFIQTFHPSIDVFYLGLILFNGLLLLFYHRYKSKESLVFLTKEFPLYMQTNLILSTLLMLVFYGNPALHGFNVILTGIMYLTMVYIQGQKQYHFVFTALVVYGVYEWTSHSFLGEEEVIVYGLLGFIFIGLSRLQQTKPDLQVIFRYTSAVVSFLAFVFISIKGIVLRWDHPSFTLVIAYFLLFANYTYLTYVTKRLLFSYLSPIFFIVAGMQSGRILLDATAMPFTAWAVSWSILTYLVLYRFNKWTYSQDIRMQACLISGGVYGYALIGSLVQESYTWLSLYLLLGSIVLRDVSRTLPNAEYRKIAGYGVPIGFALSLLSLYDGLHTVFSFYENWIAFPSHLFLVSLVSFLFGRGIKEYASAAFWTSIFFLFVTFLNTFAYPEGVHQAYIQPLLFLLAGWLWIHLGRSLNWSLTFLLSALSFYIGYVFVLYTTLHLGDSRWIVTWLFVGLLPLIAVTHLKKWSFLHTMYTVVIHFIVFLLFWVQLFYYKETTGFVWLFMYQGYAFYRYRHSRIQTLFLYTSMTFAFFIISSLMAERTNWMDQRYSFVLATAVYSLLYLFVSSSWKRRVNLFVLPFSILSFVLFSSVYETATGLILAISTLLLLLVFYLISQLRLPHLYLIPLTLISCLVIVAENWLDHDVWAMTVVSGVVSGSLLLAGHFQYTSFFSKEEGQKRIDWFSLFSLGYWVIFMGVHSYDLSSFPLPAPLITGLGLSFWFWIQTRRPEPLLRRFFQTAGLISLMYPYYVWLGKLSIPSLIETECYALPWIGLTLFLSKKTWSHRRLVMNRLNWVVLVVISLWLLRDAMDSGTVYDAILFGSYSLLCFLYGFQARIKSYFLIGTGLLLFNLYQQSKPLWGNVPWWVYLVCGGIILIAFASFHEWKKQKGQEHYLEKAKEKWKETLKKWE